MAASLSLDVISRGWDARDAGNYTFKQRLFVYLPLMHSEKVEAQVYGHVLFLSANSLFFKTTPATWLEKEQRTSPRASTTRGNVLGVPILW